MVNVIPEKMIPNRVNITTGGDRLDYYGETSTEITSLEIVKILINSILSTKNHKFITIGLSKFYIKYNLEKYQYIRFYISMIPQEIIDVYNLSSIVEPD